MRELPGGGFVAIDVIGAARRARGQFDAEVIVERRSNWRRVGHQPPIVARSSGTTFDAVVEMLMPLAQSNSAIGSALIERGLAPNPLPR
jgi:hypothetical protein